MAKGYTVTGTTQREKLGQDNRIQQVYIVYLETDLGVTGDVEVAKADWTEEKLPGILEKAANDLDLAFRLAG